MSGDYYSLYRCNSAGGNGTKDWAIKVSGTNEITVKHGKTGVKMRTIIIPIESPALEKADRIAGKMSDGYWYVGEFKITDTGKMTAKEDEEKQVWNLAETKATEFIDILKQFADDINEQSYTFHTLEAEFDPNLKGITFRCDAYLPSQGWTLAITDGFTKLDNGIIVGGGDIHYPMQLLIIAGLATRLDKDALTAIAFKGANTERSLMPSRQGLPDDFVDTLSLPIELVREIAMASGMIAKPIEIFKQGVAPTGCSYLFLT